MLCRSSLSANFSTFLLATTFDGVLQAHERRRPRLVELRDPPAVDLLDRDRIEVIQPASTARLDDDQVSVAENAKVLHEDVTVGRQRGDKLPGRKRSRSKRIQDPPAQRMRKGLPDGLVIMLHLHYVRKLSQSWSEPAPF